MQKKSATTKATSAIASSVTSTVTVAIAKAMQWKSMRKNGTTKIHSTIQTQNQTHTLVRKRDIKRGKEGERQRRRKERREKTG